MGLNETMAFLTARLQAAGVDKYAVQVSESEKRELNTELDSFALYRTTFDKSASVTVFLGSRKGSASGNDLSEESLRQLVDDARAGAESAPEDEANDIAERQPEEVFHTGCWEPDMERFYDRLREILDRTAADFPKIRVAQIIGSHDQVHNLYVNSNGTRFERFDGAYEITMEFAGNDGEKTTGIGYGSVTTHSLDRPILELGSLRRQLADTERSLETVPVEGKFEGPVLFTPEALAEFTWMLTDNFIGAGVVMDGTSLWLDKIGQPVADQRITLRLQAEDDRLVALPRWTGDGYRAENVNLIENGVLNCFLLNLYAAKKTGRPVTKNSAYTLVMEPGDTPVAEMIRGMKRGLIVGGFSGGEPGANGEFSGVAKNSFYVENGEIRGAVLETMISGNLAEVFRHVGAVSRELVSDGNMAFPYLVADGITISGK